MNIRRLSAGDKERLLSIWEEAVRATHGFLSETDIDLYRPLVRDEALPFLEVWVAEEAPHGLLGFIGLNGSKVEMLFVAPPRHGQGVGRRLLAHARALKGALTVDVNEQNPAAHAFYRRCGFTDVGRSELDGTGRPFPLVHMAQQA